MDTAIPRAQSSASTPERSPDFQNLFEAAPGRYLVLTPELTITAVSDGYLRATRTERAEVLGRALFEFLLANPENPSAGDVEELRASLRRVIESRQVEVMSVQKQQLRRAEGEAASTVERYWHMSNSPVFAKSGELANIIHALEDVTELAPRQQWGKQQVLCGGGVAANAEQTPSAAPWRSISSAGTNVVPLAPTILLIEGDHVLSASVAKVLCNRYRVLCAYDGQHGLDKALKLRPDLIVCGIRLPQLSGHQLVAELRSRPDFDHTPIMLLATAADEQLRLKLLHEGAQDCLQAACDPTEVLARVGRLIADRQRCVQTMQAHEERLAAIIGSAMDAIITTDADQRIVVFNSAAEATFGCPAAEAIGMPLDIFIPSEFREAHRAHIDRFGATGKTERSMHSPANLQGMRKDGRLFPIEATISQATIQGNKLYTVILRDMTERRQTEAALVQSQRLASLGRFAATIAHEINNPLEAVLNLLYLAELNPASGDEVRNLLRLATEEVERATQIARQTLGFSRGGSRMGHFRPAQALESVLALLAPKLRNKKIDCEKDFASYYEIEGIESEIRQVFWNLLANSIDAVGQGGRIRVRVDSLPKNGGRPNAVRVTIADNGCGIPRERAANLFQPFQTTKETGNGLGLWVCQQIVSKHHGSIQARSRSTAGRTGTVFSIVLPARLPAADESSRIVGPAIAEFAKTRGA